MYLKVQIAQQKDRVSRIENTTCSDYKRRFFHHRHFKLALLFSVLTNYIYYWREKAHSIAEICWFKVMTFGFLSKYFYRMHPVWDVFHLSWDIFDDCDFTRVPLEVWHAMPQKINIMIRLYTDSHELYDDKLVNGLQSAPNILGLLKLITMKRRTKNWTVCILVWGNTLNRYLESFFIFSLSYYPSVHPKEEYMRYRRIIQSRISINA